MSKEKKNPYQNPNKSPNQKSATQRELEREMKNEAHFPSTICDSDPFFPLDTQKFWTLIEITCM